MKSSSLIFRRSILILSFIVPFILGSAFQNRSEEDHRFYLSNYTTYSPGLDVTVNIYIYNKNWGKRDFNFRLLKIDDPISFFSKLDKSNFRYQFDIWGENKEVLLKYTSKVKDWNKRVYTSSKYNNNENIDVGKIKEPGIYILQAISENQVAYCGIVVSDLAMIYKSSRNQILAFVANSKTGKFENDAEFMLYNNGNLIEKKKANEDDLAVFDIRKNDETENDLQLTSGQPGLIIAKTKDEVIVNNPYFYFGNGDQKNYSVYVYTNQPVYRPSQEVFFKGIIRQKRSNDLINVPNEKFTVSIKSPKNKEVFSKELKSNEFGTISSSFTLDEDADLGDYSIQISQDGRTYNGSFSVEEYKKPEYLVRVKTGKEQYAAGDTLTGKISADYYFGSPVTTGTVNVRIYKQAYWRPWWYWSEYSWFYSSFYKGYNWGYGNQQQIFQTDGKLNDNGEFEFNYSVEEKLDGDFTYTITAEVTDNSRRAISGSAQAYVTRGSFTISTSPEKYFFEKGSKVKLRVNASDFSDKPIKTPFEVEIKYPDSKNGRDYKTSDKKEILHGKTDKFGKAIIEFIPEYSYTGYFNYTVSAKDEKGREIKATSSFFVGDKERYYYWRNGSGLEIIADKDSYEKGDTLIAYIFGPKEETDVLLTYETDIFLKYKKYHLGGNGIEIKEILTDKFSPSFNITVNYLNDGQFYSTNKLIGVLAKDKFLNISLTPDKKEYKPGENASYSILVKDYKGNLVPNTELSLGIIDESIYAIKDESVQDITNFFYSPNYSYIPTYNSLTQNSFSASSRYATFIDKNYFSNKEGNEKGNGNLYGKVKFKNGNTNFEDFYIILNKDNRFYKTKVDQNGNYEFKKIEKGKYDILVQYDQSNLFFIESVIVDESTKHDIEIEKTINQLRQDAGDLDRSVADEVSLSSGRGNFLAAKVESESKMMSPSLAKDKKGDYQKAELRSNFVDALIWKANIVTDVDGKAEVNFKMPDNLTTWRATARGITKNSDVGQQIDKVITRKNLLVRMETPRFFREGDELVISTIVHNYLSDDKNAKVSFNIKNLKLISSRINSEGYDGRTNKISDSTYELTIRKNSEVRIDWRVKVEEPAGEAKLTTEALTNEESDAMELKVPILPKGFKIIDGLTTDFADENKTETLQFNIPADVDLRTAKFSFLVNPSLAGTILKALDDLVGYPYGCVEQTMSRFLPTIIVANTFRQIDAPLKAKTIEELPDMAEKGLKRLYNFQHADGGWGWWENDETHPYMTAYVIYGMALAKQADFEIDENVYQKGINNLRNQIQNFKGEGKDVDNTTLAFMIYSLSTAEKHNSSSKEFMNDMISVLLKKDLNPYSLSLLIISLENLNNHSLAVKESSDLKDMAQVDNNFAYWGGKQWHYNWQDDKVQGTAFALKALLKTSPNDALISKAVRFLMMQKNGFSWRSTQETATVIFALTDYLKSTNELNPNYTVEVLVNDKKFLDKSFSKEDIFSPSSTIQINGLTNNILKNGNNKIKIIKKGSGKLYFSGVDEYFTQDENQLSKQNGFKIRREYYILKPAESSGRIIYLKQKFNGDVTSGQDIFVKTFVESTRGDFQYFMLEDMLPSGFEIVKDIDKYEIEGENHYRIYDNYYYRPWRWFYADREYRDEKVSFFVTNVNSSMEFSYIMKAQIPGKYTVMPAQGSLMYYPEVNGNSNMVNVTVNDIK